VDSRLPQPAQSSLTHRTGASCSHREDANANDPAISRTEFILNYSDRSGATIRALKGALMERPGWVLADEPAALGRVDAYRRFPKHHFVLGGADHMDVLIKEWRDYISRWGRVCHDPALIAARDFQGVVLFNYYIGKEELTMKSNMARNLRKYLKRPWDLTPMTFILRPRCAGKDERDRLTSEHREQRDRGQRLWITKPARLNRAIGIKVLKDLNQILEYIDGQEEPGEWVVQKYVERPLLLRGRKFDIRTWAVMTPTSEVWLWKEGIVRTSSELYTRDDPANLFAHITNHCIQETGPNFSKFEDGNVLRYGQLQAFLDQAHPGHDFREEIIPQMKDIIHTCFQATKSYLVHSCCNHTFAMCCFQIFGFDFLVDDGFRVWLLEVNGQPWVAEALRPEFITDVIELVINPLFRPPGWTPGPHGFEKVDLGASRFPPRPSSIIRRTSSPDD